MNDKELLEKAAKAAGKDLVVRTETGALVRANHQNQVWLPLDDDGDALRLANACKLCIEISEDDGGCTRIIDEVGDVILRNMHEHQGIDAATRRAIVRASAAMDDQPTP